MTLKALDSTYPVSFYRSKQILNQSKTDFNFDIGTSYVFQMEKFANERSKLKFFFGPEEGQVIKSKFLRRHCQCV